MKNSTVRLTRSRRSKWYAIQGAFTAELHSGANLSPSELINEKGDVSLIFQTACGYEPVLLFDPEGDFRARSAARKIMLAHAPFLLTSRHTQWPGTLYLREVHHVRDGVYWDMVVTPENVSVAYPLIRNLGEEGFTALAKQLRSIATPCSWPPGIKMNEAEPAATDSLDSAETAVTWLHLKQAVEKVCGLETDQLTLDTLIGDLGMDSLDVVCLIMELEERLEVHISNEDAELLSGSVMLGELHEFLVGLMDAE